MYIYMHICGSKCNFDYVYVSIYICIFPCLGSVGPEHFILYMHIFAS